MPLDLTISVIIPTLNSARYLPDCLASVKKQTYHALEVVVADGYSTDSTLRVAQSAGAKVIQVRGTPAACRNAAVQSTASAYVLFIDVDQLLDERLIQNSIFLAQKEDLDALIIPEVFQGKGLWARASALWRNLVSESQPGIPRFYRRSLLLASDLFDPRLHLWEDEDLWARLKEKPIKYRLGFTPIVHLESSSLASLLSKSFRYGKSLPMAKQVRGQRTLFAKQRLTLIVLKKMLGRAWESPGTTVGALLLASLKAAAFALGRLAQWINRQ